MKRFGEWHYRLALVIVAMVVFVPLLQWVRAQGRKAPVHMTTDWSNRHMIFSQPSTMAQTWRVANDPRYAHQWVRQNAAALTNAAIEREGGLEAILHNRGGHGPGGPGGPLSPKKTAPQTMRADWGMSLQAGASTGAEMFPAKFSFDINATPNCALDYVVFNSGLASAAGVAATETGTFASNNDATAGQTATITNGAASITLYANTGSSPTTALATVTVTALPAEFDTITVGAITYRFRTNDLDLAGDVLIGATNIAAAQNLRAIIDDAIGECATAGCFDVTTTTAPNPAVAHPVGYATDVVTLTGRSDGAAGNFALSLGGGESSRFTLGGSPGANGGGGANDGLNFRVGATNSATALNFEGAVSRNDATVGVTTVAPGANVVTITAAATGTDGNLIVYTSNLNHFTWAAGTLGAGQASIIAFNNLYSTQGSVGGFCETNGPSVYWSYTTSTLTTKGGVVTSPVISGDGSKIAYVETSSSGAVLHLLKWVSGEGTGPGGGINPANIFDNTSTPHAWSACAAGSGSCLISVTFNGGSADQDTNSSPFYDYSTDALYVGDNAGKLHKFTGVFLGTPAEVIGSGWPITVHAAVLSSPVKDNSSGNIFVGDSTGLLSYVVDGATATNGAHTIQIGTGGAILDAPLVDGTVSAVYAINADTTNGGTFLETNTTLSATTRSLNIGGGSTIPGSAVHMGTFDNAYLTSAGGTGSIYVCGKDPAHGDRPAIYKLTVTAGVLQAALGTRLINLTGASGEACSPITEVENTNTSKEWIFFSIGDQANGSTIPAGPCATDGNGCMISIEIDSTFLPTWPPANVTSTVSLPTNTPGGTSGIIVDNISADSQASSLYFSLGTNSIGTGTGNPGLPQCNGHNGVGCAAKLTQNGLH